MWVELGDLGSETGEFLCSFDMALFKWETLPMEKRFLPVFTRFSEIAVTHTPFLATASFPCSCLGSLLCSASERTQASEITRVESLNYHEVVV